jgi:hypothetical protein
MSLSSGDERGRADGDGRRPEGVNTDTPLDGTGEIALKNPDSNRPAASHQVERYRSPVLPW